MKPGRCLLLIFAIAALSAGCAHVQPAHVRAAERDWYSGRVRYHDGGVAIGGEADPSGWVLDGDHGLGRLYLRRQGSLVHEEITALSGRKVEVSGELGIISVGGVETPRRQFQVIDVDEIRHADPE